MAYIELTENDEVYTVLNIADADDYISNRMGGNDTFLINSYVFGISISGANNDGFRSELQLDVVQLSVSAHFNSLRFIHVLTFTSPSSATALTYNANSSFSVSQVVGSSAGIDTIHFTTAFEQANLDLSKTKFVNWGRANQTILVTLNTDTTVIRDNRFFGSAAAEKVSAGNGRDLLYGNAGDD